MNRYIYEIPLSFGKNTASRLYGASTTRNANSRDARAPAMDLSIKACADFWEGWHVSYAELEQPVGSEPAMPTWWSAVDKDASVELIDPQTFERILLVGTAKREPKTQKWLLHYYRKWMLTQPQFFSQVVRESETRSPMWRFVPPSVRKILVAIPESRMPDWAIVKTLHGQAVYTVNVNEISKHLSNPNFHHMLDYIESQLKHKKVLKHSVADMQNAVAEWDAEMRRRAERLKHEHLVANLREHTVVIDEEVMKDTPFYMVLLTERNAYDREGEYMGHCVGTHDYFSKAHSHIYSMRSRKTELPELTIEHKWTENKIGQTDARFRGPLTPEQREAFERWKNALKAPVFPPAESRARNSPDYLPKLYKEYAARYPEVVAQRMHALAKSQLQSTHQRKVYKYEYDPTFVPRDALVPLTDEQLGDLFGFLQTISPQARPVYDAENIDL